MLGKSAVKLKSVEDGVATYYRDAGNWSVKVTFENGVIELCSGQPSVIKGHPIMETTQEIWEEDNAGYV